LSYPPPDPRPEPFRSGRPASPRRHRRALPAIAVAVVVALAGCGSSAAGRGSGSSPTKLRTLRIALDYTANVNYLGIYAAIANGYFTAEGIKAEVIPYSGASAETLLGAGKTDLGLTYPPNIPASRASGLDYEAVAGLTQRNTIGIAVLASSKYTDVGQLSGTLYGGFGVPSDKPILEDVFRHAGVRDPVYKAVNLGVDAYQALAAHRVAYSIVFGGIDDVTAELTGVKLRVFPIQRYLGAAFSFPDDAWVAMDKEVKDDPALLRRGLAALARGYQFAAAHPAAAEQILIERNRTALAHAGNIVAATGAATAPTFLTPSGAWGPMDDADFTGITRILVAGGLIPASKAPAAAQDYTNSLLP
jgi:ABC-type nitrate/sulfonate/bicarbonate transport system substrate-binding protein